jgi:hypothetical protein
MITPFDTSNPPISSQPRILAPDCYRAHTHTQAARLDYTLAYYLRNHSGARDQAQQDRPGRGLAARTIMDHPSLADRARISVSLALETIDDVV